MAAVLHMNEYLFDFLEQSEPKVEVQFKEPNKAFEWKTVTLKKNSEESSSNL